MKYSSPVAANESKASIAKFAEEVATQLEFTPSTSIYEFVSEIGGTVQIDELVSPQGKEPEAIIVEPDDSFVIRLPLSTSPARDRFTVAHELGHYFLHWPLVKETNPLRGMMATRAYTGQEVDPRVEWEANWFAASFLMPKEAFAAAVRDRSVEQAARIFGVSSTAASVRAKILGLT